jgi:hypothetical protein
MNRNPMLLSRPVLFIALGCLSLALVGCTPSLVGENAAAYSMGSLHARVDRDMDSVYSASVSGLEKLEIKVTDKQKDVFGAKVVGRTSDDQIIRIKIKPASPTSTTLSIHVGVVGNEARSRAIYEQIRKELGTMAGG